MSCKTVAQCISAWVDPTVLTKRPIDHIVIHLFLGSLLIYGYATLNAPDLI